MPGLVVGRPGLRRVLVSNFPAVSPRCQAGSVGGVTGEDLGPAPARHEPRRRGEPGPVGRLIPCPADVPSQYRVLMPGYQQPGVLRQDTAEHQDGHAEYPARWASRNPTDGSPGVFMPSVYHINV
jgi:hypothetical protein